MNANDVMAEIEQYCIRILGKHTGPSLAALARRGHAIAPAENGDTPAGRCRLGGAALLEPGTPWPEIDGIPLSLLAVLDVDALAPWLGEDLPANPGLLNFFHLYPDLPWEEYWHLNPTIDPGCSRVIPADPGRAVETPAPAPATVFEQRPASAEPILTLPGYEESVIDSLDLGPGKKGKHPLSKMFSMMSTWGPEGSDFGHRAFGWPWPLQGAVMGVDEVHLLQLDTDDQWQWGDMGVLYFVIPAAALREGDFSQVRIQMDCH